MTAYANYLRSPPATNGEGDPVEGNSGRVSVCLYCPNQDRGFVKYAERSLGFGPKVAKASARQRYSSPRPVPDRWEGETRRPRGVEYDGRPYRFTDQHVAPARAPSRVKPFG
jgi:hypothetical protein